MEDSFSVSVIIYCSKLVVVAAIQELDKDLKSCKDQFKDFERQDLKHREDLKFMKQKIKKLEDKLEKVSDCHKLPTSLLNTFNHLILNFRIHPRLKKYQRSVRSQQLLFLNLRKKYPSYKSFCRMKSLS